MKFKGLRTSYNDKEEFFIVPHPDGFKLFVVPEFRSNGTQVYDGYFPRIYLKIGSAKAGLTKHLGKPKEWVEIEN